MSYVDDANYVLWFGEMSLTCVVTHKCRELICVGTLRTCVVICICNSRENHTYNKHMQIFEHKSMQSMTC